MGNHFHDSTHSLHTFSIIVLHPVYYWQTIFLPLWSGDFTQDCSTEETISIQLLFLYAHIEQPMNLLVLPIGSARENQTHSKTCAQVNLLLSNIDNILLLWSSHSHSDQLLIMASTRQERNLTHDSCFSTQFARCRVTIIVVCYLQ
jgi:hypothetical protein